MAGKLLVLGIFLTSRGKGAPYHIRACRMRGALARSWHRLFSGLLTRPYSSAVLGGFSFTPALLILYSSLVGPPPDHQSPGGGGERGGALS